MSHKGFVNLAINQFSSHGAHHQLILMTVKSSRNRSSGGASCTDTAQGQTDDSVSIRQKPQISHKISRLRQEPETSWVLTYGIDKLGSLQGEEDHPAG